MCRSRFWQRGSTSGCSIFNISSSTPPGPTTRPGVFTKPCCMAVRTITCRGLAWFTANIGLHHVHHLCSRMYCGITRARRRRTNHPVPELAVCTARLVGRGWGAAGFICRGGRTSSARSGNGHRTFVSEIMGDQVVRTPASANINLGGSSAYPVTVGIERVQEAGLVGAGIWLDVPERGLVYEEGCLHRAIISPKSHGMPGSVVGAAIIWERNHWLEPIKLPVHEIRAGLRTTCI